MSSAGVRVAVVGCGGIGGIIAGSLARAGVDVTAVTGGAAIKEAIERDGLTIEELDGTRWSARPARPPVVMLTEQDGPFDLVIVATKATTLADACIALRPTLAPGAVVLTCQNGLPEAHAATILGPGHVLGCVVAFGASMLGPGVYRRTSNGGLEIGRPHADAPDPVATATLLELAFPTKITEDLTATRWSKLALNCATSTLGAIGGTTLGALLARRWVRRLVLELWTEIVDVARAEGVHMAPVGGTFDIERMALGPAERSASFGTPGLARRHALLVAVGVKYRRLRSSMLLALERKRKPEIDFLNGEIARRGRAHGIATPINDALIAAVADLERGTQSPSMTLLADVARRCVPSLATTR